MGGQCDTKVLYDHFKTIVASPPRSDSLNLGGEPTEG